MSSGLRVGAYWPLAFVRSAIIALLALALMEPSIQRSAAPISVAYLLDVSQSVAPADIQSQFSGFAEPTIQAGPITPATFRSEKTLAFSTAWIDSRP